MVGTYAVGKDSKNIKASDDIGNGLVCLFDKEYKIGML